MPRIPSFCDPLKDVLYQLHPAIVIKLIKHKNVDENEAYRNLKACRHCTEQKKSQGNGANKNDRMKKNNRCTKKKKMKQMKDLDMLFIKGLEFSQPKKALAAR
ncbi:hypothetical protein DICVIV_08837 [Dictyocaulus viviparus]|uniref:Uncharacterized protein n=1 Tax=Dictyocaulus viviparus TaxID=29172 RepID=A0A0D8XRU2_DICVI|nr:hypothetical protein DICVIV_08837 [Dictyocaulus viviparus]